MMCFMNDFQKLQFDMLVRLDKVCRRHGLKYYLAYGTCIGAVRHKGFIPWDHDVDVLMPFDDARKLGEYQDEFGVDLYLSNYLNDKNNVDTKALLVNRKHKCRIIENGCVVGVYHVSMDIYPFYNCPPTKIGLTLNIWRSHIYKILVGGIPRNHGKLAKVIGKMILFFIPQKNRKKAIGRIEKKLNYKGKSNEIADYYGLDISFMSAITYKKEWFGKPSEIEFEGKRFYGPTDADKYLTKRYGDYMTPVSRKEIEKEAKFELITEEAI